MSARLRTLSVSSLLIAILMLGCNKPEPTEAPSTQVGIAGSTAPQPTQPEVIGVLPTSKKLSNPGPAVLTLRATGVVVDREGKSFDSKEDVEQFLSQERVRCKQPRTIFRAEKDTDVPRVRNVLLLYYRAGFREVELQEADGAVKKGPILTLSAPPKMPKEVDDIDPSRPSEPDLSLPEQIAVIVRANPTGSQTGQVRDIVLAAPAGETSFPRGKWREQLPKALRAMIESQDISNKDACVIQADAKLTYSAMLEVVELCSSSGIKRIELGISRKGRGD